MDKDTAFNKVLSGFAWESSTKFLIQIFTWVTTIIVARILSPEDYGVVAISGVFTGLLLIISDMGFMASLINKKQVDREDFESVFWLNMLLSVLMSLILYMLAPLIAHYYNSAILIDIIRISALILPIRSLKIVPLSIAMRNMDFKFRALTETTGQFVTAVTAVYLAYSGHGVWSLVYSVLTGQAVVAVIYLPQMGRIPKLCIDINRIKKIVPYGIYMTGSDILAYFTRRADVMIIGLFLSDKQVGYYSMGFHFATMPLDKIGALFNRVAFPSVSKVKEEVSTARDLFTNMHKYLLVISYPVLVGLVFVSEDLVILLLTEKWRPLIRIMQLLCMLNLLRISGMIMPYVMAGLGYPKMVFYYNLLGGILLSVAFLVGVQFDLNGVIMSWFVAYPLVYTYLLFSLLKRLELNIGDFLLTFRSAITCTTIMAIFMYLYKVLSPVQDDRIINLVVAISIGAVSYMLSYYILFNQEIRKLGYRIKKMRQ